MVLCVFTISNSFTIIIIIILGLLIKIYFITFYNFVMINFEIFHFFIINSYFI